MKLQVTSRSLSQEGPYARPWAVVVIIESENALAKSNTEQIIEDDDEYGWN